MKPNEIAATWFCLHCNQTGRFAFYNENSIGERLDAVRAEHNALSPDCELDWHQVQVRLDIDEPRR